MTNKINKREWCPTTFGYEIGIYKVIFEGFPNGGQDPSESQSVLVVYRNTFKNSLGVCPTSCVENLVKKFLFPI